MPKFSKLARIHIHLLNVSVCRYTVVYIYSTHHTISNKMKLHRFYLTPKIKYVSETVYLKYQQKILKEIAVLECENAKSSKLARFARSHIHTFSQC